MSQSNLFKSPEGWRRMHERTSNGANARRGRMDHRPLARIAAEAKAQRIKGQPRKRIDVPRYEGDEVVVRKGRKVRRVRIAG